MKIEINSREHFTALGYKRFPFEVDSRWFTGEANILTYDLDELLGTKLRALYQRKKGRDLFDIAMALKHPGVVPDRIITAFIRYMANGKEGITRAIFEKNLAEKRRDRIFSADISPLLVSGHEWNFENGMNEVLDWEAIRRDVEPFLSRLLLRLTKPLQ